MSDAPIERMIRETARCVLCGAKYGECNCWSKCKKCGWTYETGKECRHCKGETIPHVIATNEPPKRKGRKP